MEVRIFIFWEGGAINKVKLGGNCTSESCLLTTMFEYSMGFNGRLAFGLPSSNYPGHNRLLHVSLGKHFLFPSRKLFMSLIYERCESESQGFETCLAKWSFVAFPVTNIA